MHSSPRDPILYSSRLRRYLIKCVPLIEETARPEGAGRMGVQQVTVPEEVWADGPASTFRGGTGHPLHFPETPCGLWVLRKPAPSCTLYGSFPFSRSVFNLHSLGWAVSCVRVGCVWENLALVHKYRSISHQFAISTSERIQAELDGPRRVSLGCHWVFNWARGSYLSSKLMAVGEIISFSCFSPGPLHLQDNHIGILVILQIFLALLPAGYLQLLLWRA